MKVKPSANQLKLELFDKPKHEPPNYAKPCPIREGCGAYGVGCGGERGWCKRAQEATFTPGNCPHESSVVDIGGGKSFCDLWQTWTNCREVQHCVYQSAN